MRPRSALALASVALLALVVQALAVGTTSTNLGDMVGVRNLVVTVDAATTGDVVATDAGQLVGKRAQILRVVSGGETKFLLVRVQKGTNGLWVDEIAAETTTALAARILAFDLTAAAPGHPSPVNDTVDDALSAAMVGYTGM